VPAQPTFGEAPPPPHQTIGTAPDPVAPPAPAKKKGGVLRIVIGVVVLLVALGAFYFFNRNDATKAKTGDCLAGTSTTELKAENLKIVDCTSADATFKVVQRVDDKLSTESDASCTDPATLYVFWSGKQGEKGTVLCLAAAGK